MLRFINPTALMVSPNAPEEFDLYHIWSLSSEQSCVSLGL